VLKTQIPGFHDEALRVAKFKKEWEGMADEDKGKIEKRLIAHGLTSCAQCTQVYMDLKNQTVFENCDFDIQYHRKGNKNPTDVTGKSGAFLRQHLTLSSADDLAKARL